MTKKHDAEIAAKLREATIRIATETSSPALTSHHHQLFALAHDLMAEAVQHLEQGVGRSNRTMATLKELRAVGLTVAVHNDYRVDGRAHTFWLMTTERAVDEPGGCAAVHAFKGEGASDMEALDQIWVAWATATGAPRSPVAVADETEAERQIRRCAEALGYIGEPDRLAVVVGDACLAFAKDLREINARNMRTQQRLEGDIKALNEVRSGQSEQLRIADERIKELRRDLKEALRALEILGWSEGQPEPWAEQRTRAESSAARAEDETRASRAHLAARLAEIDEMREILAPMLVSWPPRSVQALSMADLAREVVAQAERWRIDAEHYRGEASNATAKQVESLSAEVARLTGEVAATQAEAKRQIDRALLERDAAIASRDDAWHHMDREIIEADEALRVQVSKRFKHIHLPYQLPPLLWFIAGHLESATRDDTQHQIDHEAWIKWARNLVECNDGTDDELRANIARQVGQLQVVRATNLANFDHIASVVARDAAIADRLQEAEKALTVVGWPGGDPIQWANKVREDATPSSLTVAMYEAVASDLGRQLLRKCASSNDLGEEIGRKDQAMRDLSRQFMEYSQMVDRYKMAMVKLGSATEIAAALEWASTVSPFNPRPCSLDSHEMPSNLPTGTEADSKSFQLRARAHRAATQLREFAGRSAWPVWPAGGQDVEISLSVREALQGAASVVQDLIEAVSAGTTTLDVPTPTVAPQVRCTGYVTVRINKDRVIVKGQTWTSDDPNFKAWDVSLHDDDPRFGLGSQDPRTMELGVRTGTWTWKGSMGGFGDIKWQGTWTAEQKQAASTEVERLDYSRFPPGYSGETTTVDAWFQWKLEHEPPGITLFCHGPAWSWQLDSADEAYEGTYQGAEDARAAAWKWYDRRLAIVSALDAMSKGGYSRANWPRCLTWSRGQVDEVERWLTDPEPFALLPEVLRG